LPCAIERNGNVVMPTMSYSAPAKAVLMRGFVLLVCTLLAACASRPPAGLDVDLIDPPGQLAAQSEPERYRGETVLWGGEILSLENRAEVTEIAVFGRPLGSNAEPASSGGEGSRFLAVIPGFLDPAEYGVGRRMTVIGQLKGLRRQLVGEFVYAYPVVEVDHHHLWPASVAVALPPPAWHHPFYDPWWRWGPYRHWPYYW
jgi:outer membrane lipoprotein